MMLKKLRQRIILMLMAVFLVLIVGVIAYMSAINAQQVVERQKQALRSAALQPMARRSNNRRATDYVGGAAFFAVRFDPSGNVTSVYQHAYDISDEEAALAAERAMSSGRTSGVLRDQQVRYLIRKDSNGYARVTFISMAEDKVQQRKQLLYSLLLIPILMLGLFLFAALPLSRWLTRPAQNAWDAQRHFIADASHELKTPLTVILANLSILLKNKQQTIESCEGWIESTQEEAQQMRKLVEEMLMLARTEDEQPAEHFTQANLSELLERTLMTIESIAFDNGVTLKTSIEENVITVCSETHIQQMMTILLDNAIKYAGGKKIVTVTLARKQERCELHVNNTGAPIPAEALPHVFDRFYRGQANRTGNGFGLGLAIAKRILQMHKGSIRVSSTAASGTTFSVVLPIR